MKGAQPIQFRIENREIGMVYLDLARDFLSASPSFLADFVGITVNVFPSRLGCSKSHVFTRFRG